MGAKFKDSDPIGAISLYRSGIGRAHSWGKSYSLSYVSCAPQFVLLIVYDVLRELSRSREEFKISAVLTFATLSGPLYLNLLFQPLVSLDKRIAGGD